jgi:hypothetical protein
MTFSSVARRLLSADSYIVRKLDYKEACYIPVCLVRGFLVMCRQPGNCNNPAGLCTATVLPLAPWLENVAHAAVLPIAKRCRLTEPRTRDNSTRWFP